MGSGEGETSKGFRRQGGKPPPPRRSDTRPNSSIWWQRLLRIGVGATRSTISDLNVLHLKFDIATLFFSVRTSVGTFYGTSLSDFAIQRITMCLETTRSRHTNTPRDIVLRKIRGHWSISTGRQRTRQKKRPSRISGPQ